MQKMGERGEKFVASLADHIFQAGHPFKEKTFKGHSIH
jgi:hypothetical protein